MSLPKYPEYKDSGVDWLGQVPKHWEVAKIKTVISSIKSGVSVNAIGMPADEGSVGVLKTSCVYDGTFRHGENKSVVDEDLSRVSCSVEAGTLIVSRMNTPALVGAAGLVRESWPNLYLPDRLWQIGFNGCIPAFAHYWTMTAGYRTQVEIASSGTSSSMQNLGQDQFGGFLIALPVEDEQRAIAAFLDRETAKIDALIAEQEKLLALLAEKRQATISHAVTRGLDPNVPMKDSGIPWLGEVPAHWDLVPCRFLVSERDERNDGAANQNYLSLMANVGVIPYAEKGDVGNKKPEDLSKCKLVKVGDLVINSMNYGIGSYGLSPLYGVCSPVYIVLEVKQSAALREFVYRIFQNRGFQLFAQSFGNGILAHRAAIGWDTLKGLQVVLPNLDEQREIVEFVKSVEDTERQMRMEGEQAIALLKERRSALIAAAVTGKIDVRGAVEGMAA